MSEQEEYRILQVGALPAKTGVYRITPEWARWALMSFNSHNRKMRPSAIERYAYDMIDNKWLVTNQGIGFSKEPVQLNDGQHRLKASVEASVSFNSLVSVGLNHESQMVIDDGCKRQDYDVVTLAGEPIGPKELGILKCMLAGTGQDRGKHTKQRLMDLLQRHRDAVRFAFHSLGGMKRIGITAAVGGVVARAYYSADRDRVKKFCEILYTNTVSEDDQAANTPLTLARFLMEGKAAGTKCTPGEVYRKTQRMLQAFLDGDSLTKAISTEKDLFPMPAEVGKNGHVPKRKLK